MEASLTTLLAVIVGAAMTFLANYILEARRLKNEKYQYKRDKIITVGEDYYRFSAYGLLRFETLLDNYETILSYDSQEARDVLQRADENLQQLLVKIGENNITITSADIFYEVSGADKAASFMQAIKAAQALVEEKIAASAAVEDVTKAIAEVKSILQEYIATIKGDRLKIKNRISKILNINTGKLLSSKQTI